MLWAPSAGARVQAHIPAQSALLAPGPETTALRGLVGEALDDTTLLARLAALLAGAERRAGVNRRPPAHGTVCVRPRDVRRRVESP